MTQRGAFALQPRARQRQVIISPDFLTELATARKKGSHIPRVSGYRGVVGEGSGR
jgi:hypothetical protein